MANGSSRKLYRTTYGMTNERLTALTLTDGGAKFSKLRLRNRCRPFQVRLDSESRRCFCHSSSSVHEIELTRLEFDLLRTLLGNVGKCMTRDALLNDVWGIDFVTGTNNVDVAICCLRKKLAPFNLRDIISTVRSIGYRLDL